MTAFASPPHVKTKSVLAGAALSALFLVPMAQPSRAAMADLGRPAATQAVDFSVHLPLRNEAELNELVELQGDPHSPIYHHFLTVAQFRAQFGPTAETMKRVAAGLAAQGFSVRSASTQSMRFRGSVTSVEHAFSARLSMVREGRGAVRVASRAGFILPAALSTVGASVSGFELRPHVHLHSLAVPLNRRGPYGGYYFTDLKQAYTYPSYSRLNGKGATIGIVISSDVLDSDTKSQFDHENFTAISGQPVPQIVRRPVLGGAPFDLVNNPGSAEASIDVQTSLGSAPGANLVLYNIPSLGDDAILAGYTDVDEENRVDVVSSSFGGCELGYTPAYNNGTDQKYILRAYSNLFKQGNSQGITFLASSGDSAGLGCYPVSYLQGANGAFIPGVETPAADPNVTAVGGTNLQTTTPPSPQSSPPALKSKYVGESEFGNPEIPYDPYGLGPLLSGGLWGSGSGTSQIFKKPAYQRFVRTGASMRTTPDVSMQMGGCPGGIAVLPCNPNTSFSIYYLGGSQFGFIGTSLSSPEFAGLLAVKIQAMKSRLGNANPMIYELAAANDALPFHFFHQGIAGYNGVVNVPAGRSGYNPIVGVGTPYAQNFIGVPQDPLSGTPQTPSNP